MARPITMLGELLINAGYVAGANTDWSVWLGSRPEHPDKCIVLYDAGGRPPNPAWLLDYPSVQIKVRGTSDSNDAAYAQAVKVKNILLGATSQDILGDRLVAVNMLSDISYLGSDEENRPEFVINFSLIIEPAVTPESNRESL